MLFYDERDGKLLPLAHAALHQIRYALGTSLCYRREWWRHHPFQKLRIGEDMMFLRQAVRVAHRLVPTAPANRLMVARVHNHQTSRKSLNRIATVRCLILIFRRNFRVRFNIISNLKNGVGLEQDYVLLRQQLLRRGHTVQGFSSTGNHFP